MAFGGGGPMHAVALARELGISKVVVPRGADVFSAWGMMMSDLRRDSFRTRIAPFDPASQETLEAVVDTVVESEQRVLSQFESEGVAADRVAMVRLAKLRYANQEHSVEVAMPSGPITLDSLRTTFTDFHDAYEKEYTYRLAAPVEFVGLHLIATADIGKLEPAQLPVDGRQLEEAVKGRRQVDFALQGVHETVIYDGGALEPGMAFGGPAIVETAGATVVVEPGNQVTVDGYGNLVIAIAPEGAR